MSAQWRVATPNLITELTLKHWVISEILDGSLTALRAEWHCRHTSDWCWTTANKCAFRLVASGDESRTSDIYEIGGLPLPKR